MRLVVGRYGNKVNQGSSKLLGQCEAEDDDGNRCGQEGSVAVRAAASGAAVYCVGHAGKL